MSGGLFRRLKRAMRRMCLPLAMLAVFFAVALAPADAAAGSSAPDAAARRIRASLFANLDTNLGPFPFHEGVDSLSWFSDPAPPNHPSKWLTECSAISPNAVGNLSDGNGTGCVLPSNETIFVASGSHIAGDGSLVVPRGTVLTCTDPTNSYCVLSIALGGGLVLEQNSRVSAGFLNVTALRVEVGNGARLDADGRGDPDETRGWNGVGGAGYGGDGAACPSAGQVLPPVPGGPGYAFAEFIDVARAPGTRGMQGGKPPPTGTGAGGVGGGCVVVATGTLTFRDGGSVSADGVGPPPGAAHAGGGSGGSVVVFAGEVVGGARGFHAGNRLRLSESEAGGAVTQGVVRAGGGPGGDDGGGGGGGGGGRIAILAPEVWPPSVNIGVGGGRSGGACGAAGFHGAAGTTLNAKTGALSVSNADPVTGRVAPAPESCLADGAWGTCAVTRLTGALPLRGIASLRVTDAAVACTDACGASSPKTDRRLGQIASSFTRRHRNLLGGGESGGGGGDGIVHLEVSKSITLTGNAHLLHGNEVASASAFGAGFHNAQAQPSSTLWVVSPFVAVADRSTIRAAGAVSFDGGPSGTGALSVTGGSAVRVVPNPPDAPSHVFNIETVTVNNGGSLLVDGAGALTITGRGDDIGALVVGDEDDSLNYFSAASYHTVSSRGASPSGGSDDAGGYSSITAGRLVVERFGEVRVSRKGAVRATISVRDAGDDEQECSQTVCPTYVYGRTRGNPWQTVASAQHLNVDDEIAIPCQTGSASPFALQLCHGGVVLVTDGGVVSAPAVHVYGVSLVRVEDGSIHADAGGCRAGEGGGRGESFAGGAGGGGGYGGYGGDGFTPAVSQIVTPEDSHVYDAFFLDNANGTVARGGAAYGDGDAPCDPASPNAGGLGSGGGAGAGAGYGGSGGGLVVVGASVWPTAILIVGNKGRVSANGGDAGGVDAGRGGGGAGGSVVVFARQFAVAATGKVTADGGGGGKGSDGDGGGGGGGGGRVHLEWSLPLNDGSGQGANRTSPDGVVTAFGGGGGDGGVYPENANATVSENGQAGTVTASPCGPGFFGLLCLGCPNGTYKSATGNSACLPCASIPTRAVFVSPQDNRGPPGWWGPGSVTEQCPYRCAGKAGLRYPSCATRLELAVVSLGGPLTAGAVVALGVMCVALPISTVVGRARAAEKRAAARERRAGHYDRGGSVNGRRGCASSFRAVGVWERTERKGRKRGLEFFSRGFPDRDRAITLSFLDDDDRAEGGGAKPSHRTLLNRDEKISPAFIARVYFSGSNNFGDPWRLPPTPPPKVRPLLHAEEWQRLVRACAVGAPASWGGSDDAIGIDSRNPTFTSRHDEKRNCTKKTFKGASRARWRGAVDFALGMLFPPLQSAWRTRQSNIVARNIEHLVDAYDRRCLRSARARALREGLSFACSDDAAVAWLDFVAQGDEDEYQSGHFRPSVPLSASVSREADGTPGTELGTHLPLAIVFGGHGTFASPWRWETAAGESNEATPAAALRLCVPPTTLARIGRCVRGALRRCRRLRTPVKDGTPPCGVRLRVEKRRGRGGGGGASFAFGGADASGAVFSRDAPATTETSNVFASVEGLDLLYDVLQTTVNPELNPHGLHLEVCAFATPGEDPFGGFQLGVVARAGIGKRENANGDFPETCAETPRDVFLSRQKNADHPLPISTPPPFDRSRDVDETAAADTGTHDLERRLAEDGEHSDGTETETGAVGSFAESFPFRNAAAWALAAATSGGSLSRQSTISKKTQEDTHFTSLRNLPSPSEETNWPRLTPATRGSNANARLTENNRASRREATPVRHDARGVSAQVQTSNSDTNSEWQIATRALLAAAPVGTVVYAPVATAGSSPSSPSSSFPKKSWSRFAYASVVSPLPSTKGSFCRVAVAATAALLVALDGTSSYSVLWQTVACDATGARLGLVLSFSLSLPFSPIAGATAAFAGLGLGGNSFRETATATRAYATWTLESLVCIFVAFTASALARSGVNALGRCEDRGGRFGGALSADGTHWFAPSVVAAVVKLLAAAAAAKRAADLDEKHEEVVESRETDERRSRGQTGG